jgi:hypothetical protein
MKLLLATLLLAFAAHAGETLTLSEADYRDRVQAVWVTQIAAVITAWPHEHQVATATWLDKFPHKYTVTPVDDDWYYEMVAIRGFEKYGINMTVEQLGAQWAENACGSWGSSEQARLLMAKGVKPPDTGHPRYNRLWFSIGPQFSADVYGALAPGMPNLAAKMAREYGHLNGYAEGVDGAVFVAGMISLGFAEKDPKQIVRKAATLIHPDSPYRQCLDEIIALADKGKSAQEIFNAVEDHWHMEYPATNNAVANGGIVATSVWFGEGDFLKTLNLAAKAADFTDADCNAANACAVVGAMQGMKCVPKEMVDQLGDRIKGDSMGGVKLTPPVDEKISDLSNRTAVIGIKIICANGGKQFHSADNATDANGNSAILHREFIEIPAHAPQTQPAEIFKLADLMKYWNADWTLDRAGFGGAGGGMGGIRGITYLDGDVLATYPRDEVRGTVLRRTLKVGDKQSLKFSAGCDGGRAWELNVYVNNKLIEKRILEGAGEQRSWTDISVDLGPFAGKEVELRLYQRVLVPKKTAGNAYWKNLKIE